MIVDNEVALFSDVLLSSLEGRPGIVLPSLRSVTEDAFRAKFKPRAITQKIVELSPSLTVAWAGCAKTARRILLKLRDVMGPSEPKLEFVRALLDAEFGEILRRRVVHLIIVISTPPRIHVYECNCKEWNIPKNVKVFVAGTGSEAFVEKLPAMMESVSCIEANITKAQVVAALSGGEFLAEEIFSNGATLIQGFGGGYEFVLFPRCQPYRWTDYCFIFWLASYENGRLRKEPKKIIRGITVDGDGGVFCAEVDNARKTIPWSAFFQYRSPLSSRPVVDAKALPDLNSKIQVNVFFCPTKLRPRVTSFLSYRPDAKRHLLTFTNGPSSTHLGYDSAHLERAVAELTRLAAIDAS